MEQSKIVAKKSTKESSDLQKATTSKEMLGSIVMSGFSSTLHTKLGAQSKWNDPSLFVKKGNWSNSMSITDKSSESEYEFFTAKDTITSKEYDPSLFPEFPGIQNDMHIPDEFEIKPSPFSKY